MRAYGRLALQMASKRLENGSILRLELLRWFESTWNHRGHCETMWCSDASRMR